MILASGELNLFVVVVMAVIGLVNWLVERSKSGGGSKPPRGAGGAPPPAGSEDERMRRFLEALGVPADSAPPPARPKLPPPVPKPAKQKRERRPAPPPVSQRSRSLDEEPAPHTPAGQIEVPELFVPVVPDFDTVASKIGAIPTERAPVAQPVAAGKSLADRIRRDLRSPEQARAAFVLREILGPPPGLQS